MMGVRRFGLVALLLFAMAPFGAAEELRPDDVLRRAEERFAGLTDYECLAEADTTAGENRNTGTYRIWFKKPHLLRIQVLRGRNRGSTVAQGPDGQFRGRKGGLLKPFVVRLKSDDSRLRSIRDMPVADIDWGTFYRKCRERMARPGARTELATRAGADAPYQLILRYHDAGKAVREHYWIDAKLWGMVGGDMFEDDQRVDHISFSEIRLDTGVADGWFKL